jgi:predicted permease
MTRLLRRLKLWLQRSRLERELAEELEFHRDRRAEENQSTGMSSMEAGQMARRQMGNMTLSREECRDLWSFANLERAWADTRYAFRMYARTPVFTATCVFSIAVGIGGNAAMFSLVNTLLVKPLPYRQPDQLVRVTGVYPRAAVPFFQDRSRVMDVASISVGTEMTLSGDGLMPAARVFGSYASANFLTVLGTEVAIGSSFAKGDDLPGKDRFVILSHALWRERFGSDRSVAGRVVLLDGTPRQVVGVMPEGFAYPSTRTQFWIPMRLDPSNFVEYWGTEFMPLLGRLRPGARIQEAHSEVRSLNSEFLGKFPYPMRRDFNAAATAIPLQQDLVGDMRERLLILLATVGVVLLIACANVSSMLLSRAAARRKEIALRSALGAGRWRIARQVLTESTVLSAIGAMLGVLFAGSAVSLFKMVLPATIPGVAAAGLDWQVVSAVTLMTLFTGLATGLAPALSASRHDIAGSVRTGSQKSATPLWIWLRNSMITAQVGMTLILLVSAGLLLQSVYRLSIAEKGFDPARVSAVRISPDASICPNREACVAFYERLQREAGFDQEVALSNSVPLDGRVPTIPLDLQSRPKSSDAPAPLVWFGAVTPGYFETMRVPLVAGRRLSVSDNNTKAERVALISSSTARRLWPGGEDPIGQHIRTAGEKDWHRVVGVVADVAHFRLGQGLPAGIDGVVYVPYAQASLAGGKFPMEMTLVARNSSVSTRESLVQMIRQRYPNVPAGQVETLDELVASSTTGLRSTMLIFSAFAAVAVLLAAIGIYGLMSYWVGQRRYEIGLRMAVGATKWRILTMVLRQALQLAVAGVVGGSGLALMLTRFLNSQLYGVSPADLATIGSSAGFLLAVAASATLLPAWRAMQVDPAIALRVE